MGGSGFHRQISHAANTGSNDSIDQGTWAHPQVAINLGQPKRKKRMFDHDDADSLPISTEASHRFNNVVAVVMSRRIATDVGYTRIERQIRWLGVMLSGNVTIDERITQQDLDAVAMLVNDLKNWLPMLEDDS